MASLTVVVTGAGGRQAPEDARRRIQEAARQLFVEAGYDGLEMGAVARAARVSRSRLYALFPGRQALLAGVVEQDAAELISRLTRVTPDDATLDALLGIFLSTFLEFVEEHKEEYRLLFGHAGRLEPEVTSLLHGFRDRLASTYLGVFRPAIEAERVSWPTEAEARLVTHAVMAMVEGAVQTWLTDPNVSRQRLVGILVAMIRRALVHPAPSQASRTA
jgi:AcrR family transcriptional regulator